MARRRDRKDMLLEAGVTLASELSLPIVLQRIVDLAAEVTDARYGALGVLGEGGVISEFITTGISEKQRKAIGPVPTGRGVLGLLIHDPRPLRLSDIGGHPQSVGFPANHPPMRSFLGAPVQAMGRVFGNIYLADKRTAAEFGDEDEEALIVLATQAGVAIANATLYEEIHAREHWLGAVRDITEKVLVSAPEPELLESIAEHAMQLAGADAATIITLTDTPGRLVVAAAVGARSSELRGQTLPEDGSISGEVMKSGKAISVEDVSVDYRAFQPIVRLGGHGPSLFAPLRVPGGATGTLAVIKLKGKPPFEHSSLNLVASLADQASVAIEYARAQIELRRLGLMEERERIAKELHDGIIQSLFAVGMTLQGTASMAGSPGASSRIEGAIEQLDGVVRDLRNYIFGLRPGILADRQLEGALQQLADDVRARFGVEVEADVDAALAAALSGRSTDIVQLTREALSNITRHARASRARLSLSREGSEALLTVEDDGVGFDPRAETVGNGLRNMRERAGSLLGRLDVSSRDGRGTRLVVRFPIRV